MGKTGIPPHLERARSMAMAVGKHQWYWSDPGRVRESERKIRDREPPPAALTQRGAAAIGSRRKLVSDCRNVACNGTLDLRRVVKRTATIPVYSGQMARAGHARALWWNGRNTPQLQKFMHNSCHRFSAIKQDEQNPNRCRQSRFTDILWEGTAVKVVQKCRTIHCLPGRSSTH